MFSHLLYHFSRRSFPKTSYGLTIIDSEFEEEIDIDWKNNRSILGIISVYEKRQKNVAFNCALYLYSIHYGNIAKAIAFNKTYLSEFPEYQKYLHCSLNFLKKWKFIADNDYNKLINRFRYDERY